MKKLFVLIAFVITQVVGAQPIDTALIHKKLTVQEMRADLDTLYRFLTESHPDLFSLVSKKQADAKWTAAHKALKAPMDRRQFMRFAAPLLSQYRDGHTGFYAEFDMPEFQWLMQEKGKLFPLFVTINNNRVFVQSSSMAGIKAGDEVLAINKKPVQQIIRELLPTQSGDIKQYATATLSRLFSYLLWLNYDWKNSFDIQMQSRKTRTTIHSEGISVDDYLNHLFVSIPGWKLNVHPEQRLAVLTVNRYGQVSKAKAFVDSAFAVIKQQGIEHVALDLRQNGGGNSAIGSYILSYVTRKSIHATTTKTVKDGPVISRQQSGTWGHQLLTTAKSKWTPLGGDLYKSDATTYQSPVSVKDSTNFFKGQFYLFISPVTFSSAHMTALSVKCNQIGLVIGEPTGERINLTGEMLDIKLPNSKLYVSLPAAVYEGACGDTKKIGVQPDVLIATTEKDVRTGNDPVLQFLVNRLRTVARK